MELFPESKDSKPSTYIDLDRDSSLWDDFITQQAKKMIKGRAASIVISWNQRDDKKGYGVGSIIIKNTNDESRFFIVPVIIKDYKLAPLDVMMIPGGKIDVFTEDNAEKYLFTGNIGKEVAMDRDYRKPGMLQGQDELFSDMMGGGINNESFQGFESTSNTYQKSASSSMLYEIHDSFSREDLERVLKDLDDPYTLYKFSGDKKIIVDIFRNSLSKKKDDKEVEVVQKIGPDAYMMMANSLESFKPSLDIVATGEFIDFTKKHNLPSEFIDEVEASGRDGVVLDWSNRETTGPVLATPSTYEKFQKVEDPGIYQVFTGISHTHCVLTKNSYDPVSDSIKTPDWHMVSNAGGGRQSGEVYGKPVSTCSLDDRRPLAGDYGYFLYVDQEEEQEPMVVGPYEILAVSKGGNGGYITTAKQDKDIWTDYTLTVRTPGMETIRVGFTDYGFFSKIAEKTNKGMYVFPTQNVAWIPMKKRLEVRKPSEDIQKTASIRYNGYNYEINGVEGLPNEWRTVDSDAKMTFLMRCCDMDMEKVAGYLRKIKTEKRANVPMELRKKTMTKSAGLEFVDKQGLTKLASYFDDMDTVDTVLSLNFVNGDNVDKFVQSLGKFTSVKEELLRLLLLSRIGNIEVPESILKQAIDILGKVIEGLQRLKAKK